MIPVLKHFNLSMLTCCKKALFILSVDNTNSGDREERISHFKTKVKGLLKRDEMMKLISSISN